MIDASQKSVYIIQIWISQGWYANETSGNSKCSKQFFITLSIGIAEIQRELTDENIEYIAKRADKALYIAKQNGRNRTVIFDPKIYD